MAITEQEGFENVPDGVAISTGNTTFNDIGGTAADMVGDDSNPIHGAISALVDPTNSVNGTWTSWPGYARGYVRFENVPGSNTWFCVLRDGGTTKTEFRYHAGSDTLQIRNGAVAVASSVQTFDSPGDIFRFEWEVTPTTQALRLFYGANLEGETPDEVLNGASDGNTVNPGDNVAFGAPVAGAGLYTMDAVAIGDDWIGPAGAVLEAEWIYFDGVEEHPVEAFQWDGVTETPLEAIVAE